MPLQEYKAWGNRSLSFSEHLWGPLFTNKKGELQPLSRLPALWMRSLAQRVLDCRSCDLEIRLLTTAPRVCRPYPEGLVGKTSSFHLSSALANRAGQRVEESSLLTPRRVESVSQGAQFCLASLPSPLGIQCLLPLLSHTYKGILSLWKHLSCWNDSSQYISYHRDLSAILGKVMVVVTARFLCFHLVFMSTGMWCWPQSIMKASQTGQVLCLGTGTQRTWGPIVIWLVSWELLFGRGTCL